MLTLTAFVLATSISHPALDPAALPMCEVIVWGDLTATSSSGHSRFLRFPTLQGATCRYRIGPTDDQITLLLQGIRIRGRSTACVIEVTSPPGQSDTPRRSHPGTLRILTSTRGPAPVLIKESMPITVVRAESDNLVILGDGKPVLSFVVEIPKLHSPQ